MSAASPRDGGKSEPGVNMQARVWVIGLNFAFGVIGMGLLGYGVDYFFGTGPVGILVGLGLGLVGGGYNFMREAMAANRASARSVKGIKVRPVEDEPSSDGED